MLRIQTWHSGVACIGADARQAGLPFPEFGTRRPRYGRTSLSYLDEA